MQMFFQYGCNMERRGLIGLDVFKVKRFEREHLKLSWSQMEPEENEKQNGGRSDVTDIVRTFLRTNGDLLDLE